MNIKSIGLAAVLLATSAGAADAVIAQTFHNPGKGCRQLINLIHPDFAGAAFRNEMRKCKSDPQGYNASSGLAPPPVH